MMLTVPATPAARLTIWAFGLYSVWQGLGVATGGDQRWGGASFAVLRTVPHPTLTWGLLLVAVGLAVLAGSLRRWWWMKAAGLSGLALWSLLFAIGGLEAAALIATQSNTGGKTYSLIAFVAVVLIWVDESRPVREEPRAS